jgi:hypothetical protein
MMDLSAMLALLAVACAIGSILVGVQIATDLRSWGIHAKPLLVRWMIFRYMAQYLRITIEETDKVEPLCNKCATLSALAGILAIGAIIAKLL